MRVVVNRLNFRDPIPDSVVRAAELGARALVDAGGLNFRFVRLDKRSAVLVMEFADLESEQRIAAEIGGPWMREHIIPLLDGPTQRISGEVIVSL